MKLRVVLGVSLTLLATPLLANDAERLAHKKGCFSCHNIERAEVGPSWKEVASKYRDNSNATHQLAGSILYGSMGKWGQRPMRGHAKSISQEEALTLAEFILNLE